MGEMCELYVCKEVIFVGGVFDILYLLQVSGIGFCDFFQNIGVNVVSDNLYVGEDFWDYVFVLFVFKLVEIVDVLFDMVNIDGIEYNNIVELFRINGLFIWILYL